MKIIIQRRNLYKFNHPYICKSYLLTTPSSNSEAFTLVELIVVVVIIGVLSAIAIPSFLNFANKATELEGSTAVNSFIKAGQMCYLDQGTLPKNAGELSQCIPVPACQWAAHLKGKQICKTWKPLEMGRDNPSTPQWNSPSGFFNIRMSQSWPRLHIRSIPYFSNASGASACFNAETGSTSIGLFQTNPSYYTSGKRHVGIGTNNDVPELQC